MPNLKTRMLFISHAWKYDEQYWTIVNWFNEEPNFQWKNCSVPSHEGLPDTSARGLSAGITRQISPAQGVIIIGGMYAAHSDWIDFEISEAVRMGKVIIGIRPSGQERVPVSIQQAADRMVGWSRASLIQAVRDLI